ncbi:MAG: chemotaxis protein MotB [Ulvibacter sp.]|jgi:chemotaxis protein MotB
MKYLYLLISIAILSSCVTGRKFEDVEREARNCNEKLDSLSNQNDDLQTELNEIKTRTSRMNNEVSALKSDTSILGSSFRVMRGQYDKINDLNEQLLQKHSILMSNNESEKKKLLDAVLTLQDDLGEKEIMLDNMKSNLDKIEADLKLKSAALEEREARVKELERLINEKEAVTRNLKDKISKALLKFRDQGLTVEEKDGRVYVSLEAKLLFASGSTKVGKEGEKALIELAKAIESQKDLTILVEGHTDSDGVGSSLPFEDNWDLSVLRSTSVVRILLNNSNINPKILTAAGRSQYLPLDENDKAKNRRIEVILIPDLKELFQILEN